MAVSSRHQWLIVVALAVATWVVFGQVARFDFVNWDDHEYVTGNPDVAGGLSGDGLVAAFTTNVAANWHPVTVLSHQLDVELHGLDARGHHLTSLWIHLANGLLLFGLLRSMTGAAGRSAFVAAVFLLHPLHAESVAWVSERKDVLSTFFALLATGAYLRYVGRRGEVWYLAMVGLYALALMAKPMVVTLPVLLLLLDWWPLGRVGGAGHGVGWRRAILEKMPLFALAVLAGLATIAAQAQAGALASLHTLPVAERVAGAVTSVGWYLWKAVWPTGLAAFYPRQPVALVAAAGCALLLVGVTMAAVRFRRTHPYLLAGWAWYLVGVAPVIGLVQVGEQARADRYTYVPLIGVTIVVAWAAWQAAGRARSARAALGSGAVIAVVLLAAAAHTQAGYWANSLALWRRAITVTTGNARAYENLGTALRERGSYHEALAAYAEASRLAPRSAVIHNSMGLVLAKQGRIPEAVRRFEEAVMCAPAFVQGRTNLGNALAAGGRLEEARTQLEEAIRLDPDSADAHVGLGGVLLRLNRLPESRAHFLRAIRLDAALAEAHNGLGGVLATQGRHDDALAKYQEAIRLKPGLVTAHANLALSLIKLGRPEEARRSLEVALRLDPCHDLARQALAAIR
jgi:tetratricopeptide (TPR) repeat protein